MIFAAGHSGGLSRRLHPAQTPSVIHNLEHFRSIPQLYTVGHMIWCGQWGPVLSPNDELPPRFLFICSSFSGPHVMPDTVVKVENQEAEATVWILLLEASRQGALWLL